MKPNLTLLVVDDDAGMRAWLAAFAAEQGWAVECAGSGEQGLEIFRARTPELVTLDLSLPGMDGLATLRQLRALAPDVLAAAGTLSHMDVYIVTLWTKSA